MTGLAFPIDDDAYHALTEIKAHALSYVQLVKDIYVHIINWYRIKDCDHVKLCVYLELVSLLTDNGLMIITES